jgi:hypothetical protein
VGASFQSFKTATVMPLKTYETIGILNRHTSANIDGIDVPIHFINGTESPRKIQGRFTTKDPKVQAWIENSGNFNKKYRLVSTVPLPSDATIKPPIMHTESVDDDKALHAVPPAPSTEDDLGNATPEEPEVPEEPIEIKPEPEPSTPNIIAVGDEVVNGQQARNYLMEHYKNELNFRQVQNNTQIIAEAKARNIQFTQWEAFVTAK